MILKQERRMPNHYWVTTPEVLVGSYEEGYEDSRIVECVEAKNKKEAKTQFVKQQYKEWKEHTYFSSDSNWFYHLGSGDNPFVGLKATQAMCKHGVCLCADTECALGVPRDPASDWCTECNYDGDKEHYLNDHNALSGSKCNCMEYS